MNPRKENLKLSENGQLICYHTHLNFHHGGEYQEIEIWRKVTAWGHEKLEDSKLERDCQCQPEPLVVARNRILCQCPYDHQLGLVTGWCVKMVKNQWVDDFQCQPECSCRQIETHAPSPSCRHWARSSWLQSSDAWHRYVVFDHELTWISYHILQQDIKIKWFDLFVAVTLYLHGKRVIETLIQFKKTTPTQPPSPHSHRDSSSTSSCLSHAC